MNSVIADFEEKRIDIDILLDHINEVSYSKGSNAHKVAILKSSFILVLYNTIESTISLILEKVHETASMHNYDELSDKLKLLFVEYYFVGSNGRNHKNNLDMIIINNVHLPSFSEFGKRVRTFSGNLDAREINIILSKYGIGEIKSKNKDKLLIVKNLRNKIAHGEVMFKESCRNYTISDLYQIRDATELAMQDAIANAEHFIKQTCYLKKCG
ncbi:MAE_28990/MAE_18760 family HEPN-like nuclease [Vibrio cholerae]|uniref:MAE_28990/MAE_18760 family HEPN-like nuclease n=1 Tax=Vibrio cholerae TaxID=666 RepID=UPI0008941810|nr:MAE_28990/MAE_18760 family HEPN-like nuclease [Vibrio cholerae]OFJ34170.1 hypothetical protein BFX32_15315 [Vibrio cholerae]WOQ88115.1 MAE_28990/MAE_18760 family HEPN-like nuclease [Vibrio cholerae]